MAIEAVQGVKQHQIFGPETILLTQPDVPSPTSAPSSLTVCTLLLKKIDHHILLSRVFWAGKLTDLARLGL